MEISAVCPIHGVSMTEAVHWIRLETGASFPKPIFVCPQENCLQCFDVIRGHYTEPENAVIGRPLASVIRRSLV